MPASIQNRFFRPIQAQSQIERSITGGHPVRLEVWPGVLALNVENERPVCVELQMITVPDGQAVDRICNEPAPIKEQPQDS
jgi:hypothetical protein